MGHVVRHARIFGSQLMFSSRRATSGIGEFCGDAANGAPRSDLVQSFLGSVRGFATSGHSQVVLRHETFWGWNERLESATEVDFGARDGLSSLLGCGFGSSASFPRRFSSNSFVPSSGIQVTTTEHGLGFHQRQALIALQRSAVRGDRGFAKAVALPPQMQKPMKLRVYMGSPGVIGEPWKPLPPPLPFLKRWFTKEGWKIRKQNVQGMVTQSLVLAITGTCSLLVLYYIRTDTRILLPLLKTGFTLAKIRQKTKGYNQTKFYRDASDLYKEINSALAAGDRSALRQLVTDNVLTTMKKELKHREQAWTRVHWELVGPMKTVRTLQGRLIGIDQKNMDTAFAQLTLRIISNQKFAAYDKQGKLVAGDPEKELTVEDIWIFERQISHPELRWKLCGRLSV